MPIYEYRCASCEKSEEILQKVNEAPPEACSYCHTKGSMHKQVSNTSFQLKGGGWYKDLYASTKKESGPTSTSAPSEKKSAPSS